MMFINIYLLCVFQIHGEVPSLPRLPELYLEAGTALLMARRTADCMVLCDEVISTTVELLPEKLVLEEPEERSEVEIRSVDDRLGIVLWAGAAYLLQGHCHTHLQDWKQAVTHYTRFVKCVCFDFHLTVSWILLRACVLQVYQPAG